MLQKLHKAPETWAHPAVAMSQAQVIPSCLGCAGSVSGHHTTPQTNLFLIILPPFPASGNAWPIIASNVTSLHMCSPGHCDNSLVSTPFQSPCKRTNKQVTTPPIFWIMKRVFRKLHPKGCSSTGTASQVNWPALPAPCLQGCPRNSSAEPPSVCHLQEEVADTVGTGL